MLTPLDLDLADYAQYKLDAVETHLSLVSGLIEPVVIESVEIEPVPEVEIVELQPVRRVLPPIPTGERDPGGELFVATTKALTRLKVDEDTQAEYFEFLQGVQYTKTVPVNIHQASIALRYAYEDTLKTGWQHREYTFTEQCVLGLVFGRLAYIDKPLPLSVAVEKLGREGHSELVVVTGKTAFITGMKKLSARLDDTAKLRDMKVVEKDFDKRTKAAKKRTTGDA